MSKNAAAALTILLAMAVVLPLIVRNGDSSAPNAPSRDQAVGSSYVRIDESALDSQAAQRIRTLLQAPATVDVDGQPLRSVLVALFKTSGIVCQFDARALEDEGFDLDELISVHFSNMPLRSVLDNILLPRSLDWYIARETVIFTTKITAWNHLETRAFDISDLLRASAQSNAAASNPKSLIVAIMNYTRGPWEELGGEGGTLNHYQLNGADLLFVRHTWRTQDEVDAFLANLRRVKRGDSAQLGPNAANVKSTAAILSLLSGGDRNLKLRDSTDEEIRWLDSVVEQSNAFAIGLYSRTAERENGNFVVAPNALMNAMLPLWKGARGETAAEIGHVFDISNHGGASYTLAQLRWHLLPRNDVDHYRLLVANRLWGSPKNRFTREFVAGLEDEEFAELRAPTVENADAFLRNLNDWTRRKTENLLPQIVAAADFSHDDKLIVTSASTFVAERFFECEETRTADFFAGDKPLRVPTMSLEGMFETARLPDAEMLKFDYIGDELSMLIIAPPKEKEQPEAFESTLTWPKLKTLTQKLTSEYAKLTIPRFQIRTRRLMNDVLSAMGIIRAFDRHSADFSGMASTPGVCVDRVLHEALVGLTETGTNSQSQITGFGWSGGQMSAPVFAFDRPFIFLVRENKSGCILFIGRVVNPE